jgi:hypothetical protein
MWLADAVADACVTPASIAQSTRQEHMCQLLIHIAYQRTLIEQKQAYMQPSHCRKQPYAGATSFKIPHATQQTLHASQLHLVQHALLADLLCGLLY